MNCYNGQKYLREALTSIINQTYTNWELIFWDNRSSDASASIYFEFKDSRLKYFLAEGHTSLGEARARASNFLDGEYIAVLDVDDIWLPTKLEKQVDVFEKDSNIGVVVSNTEFFSVNKSKVLHKSGYQIKPNAYRDLLKNYNISLETVLIRKYATRNRLFNAKYSHIADFELIMRALETSQLFYIDEVLGKWRVHEDNNSWLYPNKFNQEKNKWAKEKKNDDKYYSKYKAELDYFINKIYISRLIKIIINKPSRINIGNISRLSYKFILSWAVLACFCLPLTRKYLIYRLRSKYLLDER
jgi:glycosyltransferase involved in cell wall biosynthesis